MLRYLTAAFWSRPQLPLLRFFPWNALLVAGTAVAGFADPVVWLAAGAFETLYLATLATNPQFQRWVDMRQGSLPETAGIDRDETLRSLGGAARQRFVRVEQKLKRLEQLAETNRSDDLLFESNRDALRQLATLHLRLLAAQRNLLQMRAADADELRTRIAQLEEDLRNAPDSVRESKRATHELLTQRLRNFERRDEALKEIESDLTRIEAQIDLAVEEASMKDHPVAISTNVGLVSRLIDDSTTTSTTTPTEIER